MSRGCTAKAQSYAYLQAFLVEYSHGLRVVILSANLVENECDHKTQVKLPSVCV